MPVTTEPLPDRRRRLERAHVADPLLGRRPLERVEEPVVRELHAAVERVLRAGRELGRRGVEVVPDAAVAERGEGREPASASRRRSTDDAGGVELEDGEHG